MNANLEVFRISRKRESFAGSVNDPIEETENRGDREKRRQRKSRLATQRDETRERRYLGYFVGFADFSPIWIALQIGDNVSEPEETESTPLGHRTCIPHSISA